MLHKRIPKNLQNETVVMLNKLYEKLEPEDRLMILREQQNHLFWMLELLFTQYFNETFEQSGPFKNIYDRNLFIDELKAVASENEMQNNWNISLLISGQGDSQFLEFLREVDEKIQKMSEEQ